MDFESKVDRIIKEIKIKSKKYKFYDVQNVYEKNIEKMIEVIFDSNYVINNLEELKNYYRALYKLFNNYIICSNKTDNELRNLYKIYIDALSNLFKLKLVNPSNLNKSLHMLKTIAYYIQYEKYKLQEQRKLVYWENFDYIAQTIRTKSGKNYSCLPNDVEKLTEILNLQEKIMPSYTRALKYTQQIEN